ncbi:hypothetical protein KIW84_053127 [Lathyrus oleraceus]|uniref:SNF2 N-terminal domain-containing protein n=1 Tax=Pisum sativum TaxID=3888 RepID=A0A9D4WPL0_PEA|nr:hypothetical protein KIW84_053127 [Pisum sativum]
MASNCVSSSASCSFAVISSHVGSSFPLGSASVEECAYIVYAFAPFNSTLKVLGRGPESDCTEGSNDEDDCDVCIIEDISHPAPTSRSAELNNSLNMSQSSRFDYTKPYMAGGTKPKPRDEQYILRVALQDLSQPKSEVSPPDGLLAVPLLRHQRIALSRMVQKETSSLYCSGGILADDQGLGKTASTISLILKERAPLLKTCKSAQKVH